MAYRSTPHCYILLRDISKNYPRGTLLELNEDGSYTWHTHRTKVFGPDPIRCDNDGDVAPLSEVECDLLDGIGINCINSDAGRYEVYSTPGKLEWGRSLKVGDTVLARLPVPLSTLLGPSVGELQHQYATAIIRWYGKVDWETYQFGVEIVVSSYVYNT